MTSQRSIFNEALLSAARLGASVLAAAVLVACGQQSPEKLMASAKEHLAKGDRRAAVIQLKSLLQQAPNNGEARLLLGQELLDSGDAVSAEKELSRALELKQPQEKVLPPYAQALLAQRKYKEVIAEIEKYKLFTPAALAPTQTALGDAYRQTGSFQLAGEAYAAAVAAVPGYPRARLGQIMLVAFEGGLDDAMKQIDAVIAAAPKLAEARAFKADLFLAKGDQADARKMLEEAVATDGSYMPARFALISLLVNVRAFDEAAAQLAAARKVAANDLRVNYYDALLAFRQGEISRAREQVQQVLKFLPGHVPALVLAGSIELQDKQFSLAESHLRKALGRAPGHREARRMLVATQLKLGQPAKAKDTLQPLIDKGMPADRQLLLLAGETYLANGDAQRASAFYQAASTKTNGGVQEVAAKTRLGQIALATGRFEEGFEELQAASDLDAGGYQADLAIVAGHLRRNEIDKAMAAVQALEKKQPKNPLTFQMYGVVHLAKRDAAAARRNFEKALELQPNYLPAAYNLGMLDLAEKRPEDARKRYETMIAKDEKNDQVYAALAEMQSRMGLGTKAVAETLQRGINANPQSVAARVALINFYLGNRDAKSAMSVAQIAMAAMPDEPQILDVAATALEAAGETNQAIQTYNKLAVLQPQALQPLLRLAALHAWQQETDKAIEALRRAQKIAPRLQNDLVPQIVQLYLAGNRPNDALKEALDLQKRQPKLALAHALEGEILVSQGKPAEAERALRAALRLEPKSDIVAIRFYEVLLAEGKTAEADAFSKKWIAENPKNITMHLYLGERELAARNLKASAAHYQAVVAVDPNNGLALNNLAWIGGELGDPRALEYAERAVTLAPNNASALDTYGMLLVMKGETAKAISFLERAQALEPNRIDLRLHYAQALIKANRKDDARKELNALSRINGQFVGKDEVERLLKSL